MAEVSVSSAVGVDGNSYTTSVSNDQLTSNDFLKLMIQELKLQDPTKPMDSAQMLSTQMQMSTLNTNQEMIKAMQEMQTAYSQTALSNATGIIGKNIESGNVGEDGVTKAYTVRSIENVDGEIQVKAQQILYLEDKVILKDPADSSKNEVVNYNINGEILDENGEKTGKKIVLTAPGTPLVSDGKLTLLDENNEIIAEHNYALAGVSTAVYSDELTSLPFSSITKIF
ncbi:MAG: flagellar hook capping FlgD N-terminal domain-containing protein [Arcobacter sp.]|jgi:flagellar basal-body rod modification protein FlgD|uniref:flagellar hook assembly protein FlgD n=1 Tax=unclassified Arcobacter TaxID=2593671 RepID=UPI0002295FBD|nr:MULTISPECIES: flagellar hook capping FlgD N-terminal domain-containing protein [unclassified Arcobacter]MDY3200123.1 flagellar hook capping FlgD N-terminal domain-containing protein [Arcobacter sp.]BAK74266.1 flagellar hook assembly protein FlgD [Arcobacter sp. L]